MPVKSITFLTVPQAYLAQQECGELYVLLVSRAVLTDSRQWEWHLLKGKCMWKLDAEAREKLLLFVIVSGDWEQLSCRTPFS